jgi:hypothetical protein
MIDRAMSRTVMYWAASIALMALPMASAQERQPAKSLQGAMSIEAKTFESLDVDLKTLRTLPAWKQGDRLQEVNPRQHYDREDRVIEILKKRVPDPLPRIDPLLGFQRRAFENLGAFSKARELEPGKINIEGQAFTGVNPPDVSGDVSKDHYIQAINSVDGTSYTIYKKADGSVEAGPFQLSDLGGQGVTGLGDPIVLYDHLANRWLLSEFTRTPGNAVHVYISKTPDPVAGGWHHYRFDTPTFPDYPKFGVWPDAFYMTSNESDGPAVYAFDRTKMLEGNPQASLQRFLADQLSGFGFQALTPVDLDGAAAPPSGSPFYVMRHRDDEVHNVNSDVAGQDFLELYELRIDWANPANSTMVGPNSLSIAEIDSDLNGLTAFSCFPQMGSNIRLDPLREVIMHRLPYRNFGTHETIVGSFVTDVDGQDHGGVRWFELRKNAGGNWVVHQEGTYAPDSHSRWMSSIAMDGSGNITIAFNVSSTTMFPSLRYAGRLASDPMGTMPRGEVTLINGTAPNASSRYGDYSTLSVDPADDHLFWFTGEYNPARTWSTRIGTFRFGEPALAGGRAGER